MVEARNELIKFIQEGNGIREKVIALLEAIQRFRPRLFESYGKQVCKFDTEFSQLYKQFLDYDKRAGLFSETLAMAIATDMAGNFARLPTLDENTLFSIYTSHLSLHRETLRNLLRDTENRINNHKEILNNKKIRYFSGVSLFVAVVGILLTIVTINQSEKVKILEFSNKVQSIHFENAHNQKALAQHISEIKDNKIDFGASHYYFLTDFYKNNWEIISQLSAPCVQTYFDLIISMGGRKRGERFPNSDI